MQMAWANGEGKGTDWSVTKISFPLKPEYPIGVVVVVVAGVADSGCDGSKGGCLSSGAWSSVSSCVERSIYWLIDWLRWIY